MGSEQIFKNWWSGNILDFSACTKIYKRALWDGVSFKEGHISEDTGLVAVFTPRAQSVYISDQGKYYYQQNRQNSYTYQFDFSKHLDMFYAHSEIYECFSSFPNLVSEKVVAFTRLYRRLITAKQTDMSADISAAKEIIEDKFFQLPGLISVGPTASTINLIGRAHSSPLE